MVGREIVLGLRAIQLLSGITVMQICPVWLGGGVMLQPKEDKFVNIVHIHVKLVVGAYFTNINLLHPGGGILI